MSQRDAAPTRNISGARAWLLSQTHYRNKVRSALFLRPCGNLILLEEKNRFRSYCVRESFRPDP